MRTFSYGIYIVFICGLLSYSLGFGAQKEKSKEIPTSSQSEKKSTKAARKKQKKGDLESIAVSPSNVILFANPEQTTLQGSFKAFNPMKKKVVFHVDIVALVPTRHGLESRPLLSQPAGSLAREIILENSYFEVPPQDSKEVKFTVWGGRDKEKARKIGDHLKGTNYVGISLGKNPIAKIDTERKSAHTQSVGVGVSSNIMVPIRLNINNTLVYRHHMGKLKVVPPKGNRPVSFKALFRNTGNAEFVLLPLLLLVDKKTKQAVARLKPKEKSTLVPSGEKEIIFSSVFHDVPPGKYQAMISLVNPPVPSPPVIQDIVVPKNPKELKKQPAEKKAPPKLSI